MTLSFFVWLFLTPMNTAKIRGIQQIFIEWINCHFPFWLNDSSVHVSYWGDLIKWIEVILENITNRWNTLSSGLKIFSIMLHCPLDFIHARMHSSFNKYSAVPLHAWHFLCRTENKVVNYKHMFSKCHNRAYAHVDSGAPHSPIYTILLPTQPSFAVIHKCLLTDSCLLAFNLSLSASSISSPECEHIRWRAVRITGIICVNLCCVPGIWIMVSAP